MSDALTADDLADLDVEDFVADDEATLEDQIGSLDGLVEDSNA